MSKVNPVLDADKIQDNVVLCLVNSTQNEELLKDVPNRSCLYTDDAVYTVKNREAVGKLYQKTKEIEQDRGGR